MVIRLFKTISTSVCLQKTTIWLSFLLISLLFFDTTRYTSTRDTLRHLEARRRARGSSTRSLGTVDTHGSTGDEFRTSCVPPGGAGYCIHCH